MGEFRTERLRPEATGVYGTFFIPDGEAPDVAVLLIGGSGGNEPAYLAELLANEGIAALSVSCFGEDGLPAELAQIELDYFRTALVLLQSRLDDCDDLKTVVMGQSRGSEAALLTAVHFAELVNAVVVTVPSNVVLCGYPDGGPAWLLHGVPLPYTDDFGPSCDDPAAIIPVESISGPAMFVAAGADEVWPSASMARAMSERLIRHGDAHGHQLLEYADATHSLGYLRPCLKEGLLGDLADPAQTQAARGDAWPKVLAFVRAPA